MPPKRPQPGFSGRQSFYSSGYIHYAGPSGNVFRMPIAKDATPGSYYFFCIVHGPLMSTYVEITGGDGELVGVPRPAGGVGVPAASGAVDG